MKKRIKVFLLTVVLLLSSFSNNRLQAVDKHENTEIFLSVAEAIINWKKADNGSLPEGFLINETFLELAGSTPGDWFPIGLGRLGINDNYDGYLAVIKDRVAERYREQGKLSAAKATEWHRISLAVLAMGGDPTNLGNNENGQPIDLIADGCYDRGKTASLGRQGINGWIWGLIALDSMRYSVPENAYYTREDIIIEILRQQLEDGGFALSGKAADPDITAMAVQALAPYYNSEKIYSYTPKNGEKSISRSVYQVVDEAVACLSELQLDTGDYKSWGTQNVESTDQVAVALCCLGIDPLSDERFIKNGNTLLDGILRYRMDDGGFVHSFVYDPDNPASLPDRSNTMAGEQTLYTMAALWRQAEGMRTLYDFREEQSAEMKARIGTLKDRISCINEETEKSVLENLLVLYYSIPEDERSYVYNYRALSDAAKAAGADIGNIAETTRVVEDSKGNDPDSVILYFSESDKALADTLPEKLTTEQYVIVITLLDKLRQSEDFDGKDEYLKKLTEAKETISNIQKEIDSINADIKEKLYPFDGMSIKDKKTVDSIVERYEALSEYDRGRIERWDDVIKTKTKIDNLLRALKIAVLLGAAAAVITVFLALRVRKKRMAKALAMEELAAQYAEENGE